MTLICSKTTVPVNGATFRPNHTVLLAEQPHAVIDINDSMATCDYDDCTAGDDVNVVNNTSGQRVNLTSVYA